MRPFATAILFLSLALVLSFSLRASPIKRDEEVVFFPTAAHLSADLSLWFVPVHAWVFEPEEDSLLRAAALEALARALGLDESAAQSDLFKARARWFLVDNERGKRLRVTLSEAGEALGPTGANGHLEGELRLRRRAAVEESVSTWLGFAAVLPPGDGRTFTGETLLVAPRGLSVISDIDDTIKISQVTDKRALLANTFLEPFRAAPGVSTAYGRLAAADTVFHYVSSSPWQLYRPLADFMTAAGFPRGSFHLRDFRVKDETFFNLLKSSMETKPPVIEALLAAYPQRAFILIGDSGEQDPEIYGQIARSHPGQIRHIYIRKVTPEGADDDRYRTAFADLAPELWTLFDDPGVISP